MNAVTLGAFAITAAVFALMLRGKNSEIALLLTIACSVGILIAVLQSAASVIETVRQVAAVSRLNGGYLAVLLKVIGICLMTEFTANTCRDAGSAALASHVTLAGKLMATAAALPLYADILNTVLTILKAS